MGERFMNNFLDMSSEMWGDYRTANSQIIMDLHVESDKLRQELYNCRHDLDTAKTEIDRNTNLIEVNDGLKNTDFIRENNVLSIDLKASQNSIENLSKENKTLSTLNVELKQEGRNKLSEISGLRKEIEGCREEINVLKRQIHDYSSSKDNRMTENYKLQEKLDRQISISVQLRKERDIMETKYTELTRGLRSILGEFDNFQASVGDTNNFLHNV